MARFGCRVERLNILHFTPFIVLYLVSLAFLLSVWFMFNYNQSVFSVKQMQDIAVSTSETTDINAISLTAENLKSALIKSEGFLAATRKNSGKMIGTTVCVVDPAITDCQNIGFAVFLLYTLDYIILCRALGIHRPTVFWRACNSVCSKDTRVNSWDWYFEPVNRGLESKVDSVFCPLRADGAPLDVGSVIDNSFKNRTDVEGFEYSRIITKQERFRVNKLIRQYIKPNLRIKTKVKMFYQKYLAGFNVLGIHVRGTDHWLETSEQTLPSLMSWIKKAQSILVTLARPRKIFIASDNHEVIKTFVTYFGKETVSVNFICISSEWFPYYLAYVTQYF